MNQNKELQLNIESHEMELKSIERQEGRAGAYRDKLKLINKLKVEAKHHVKTPSNAK